MSFARYTAEWETWTPAQLQGKVAAMQKNTWLTGNKPPVVLLNSVKAVGAVFNRDGTLHPRDTAILKNTMQSLIQSGIGFAGDFTIDVVNLADQRDYLQESVPADLHVFCYVFSPRLGFLNATGKTRGMLRAGNESALRNARHHKDSPEFFLHHQSGLHYEPGSWINAARTQGAKIIATFGGRYWEINTRYFKADDYIELIRTKDDYSAGDTPTPHPYGFLMQKEFLRTHGPLLSASTRLADEARHKAQIMAAASPLSPVPAIG